VNPVILMRYGKIVALIAILFVAAPPLASAATGNANFFLGLKAMNDGDWEPLEDQGEFGAEITFGRSQWPVLFAIDVLSSADDDTVSGIDFDASTSELDLGVRKIWELNRVRPYVGGGVAFVSAELEGDSGGVTITDDDESIGAWVGGGVFWRIGTRFNIGAAVRYSKAEVTIFDTDVEAGGWHFGMLAGWGWPAYK